MNSIVWYFTTFFCNTISCIFSVSFFRFCILFLFLLIVTFISRVRPSFFFMPIFLFRIVRFSLYLLVARSKSLAYFSDFFLNPVSILSESLSWFLRSLSLSLWREIQGLARSENERVVPILGDTPIECQLGWEREKEKRERGRKEERKRYLESQWTRHKTRSFSLFYLAFYLLLHPLELRKPSRLFVNVFCREAS